METTIPLFPCKQLQPLLEFYRSLGFEVTYQQEEPYMYASVSRNEVVLHFSSLTMWGSKHGVCLVMVPDVTVHHREFARTLRAHYSKIPTADYPRITRLRPEQTRFHMFDPSGNVMVYINQVEAETNDAIQQNQSPLLQALENAVFLRDTYANDKAAARALDLAIERNRSANALERARVLAARAEIAVAMGDMEFAQHIRDELNAIPLSAEDSHRYCDELQASDRLEQWIKHPLDTHGD